MNLADRTDDELLDAVRPSGWSNPGPAGRYDLVVIGGGTAGLVAAMGGADLGARVALVERHRLGGDCLNTGCVPSKALLRSAQVVGELRRAAGLGIDVGEFRVDFGRVMQRLRDRRSQLAANDSAARFRKAGVDVFFGQARFSSPTAVDVDGQELSFRRAVIATGGRPAVPPIDGLDDVPFLTNENVFDLTTLPRRLLVIGAGPIGCELAQAFARFGSAVTIIDRGAHVLPRDEPDAAAIVEGALERDGVQLVLGAEIDRITARADEIVLNVSAGPSTREPRTLVGDALLVAAGRAPNVEGLDLVSAGVEVSSGGVAVDDRMRTSNPRVYASGDVCSRFQFTHAADAQSRLVLQNALFFGRRRASRLVMPWVTFTDPGVAHVGVTHADVAASDGRLAAITVQLSEVDRAVVDEATDGFVRVYHERGRLRGCTIVAAHAGEMIGEAAYAVTHAGTLGALSSTVHPYPTQAEALRRAGDMYRRQALTPSLKTWFERYFKWTR